MSTSIISRKDMKLTSTVDKTFKSIKMSIMTALTTETHATVKIQ